VLMKARPYLPAAGMTQLRPRGKSWKPAEADLPRVPTIAVGGSASTIRVLLVEDSPGDARLVMLALRESNAPSFRVTHAATLGEALAHLAADHFDVVLLDLSLPDSQGISTLSRAQAAAPRTAIVVMTGLDDPAFAAYALEVGAQDYLVKSDEPGPTVARSIRYAITRMNAQMERQELIGQLNEEKRILTEEVAAARVMQYDLLPKGDALGRSLADLGLSLESYFEPCSGIGGDLWGCMDLGEGRISVFSFDFSGHGISAALNVFRLHALIREHKEMAGDPVGLLEFLARTLSGLLGRGQFATMFAGVVDCRRNLLSWAGAGAPRPILLTGQGMEWLDTRGTPLGVSAEPVYASHCVDFPPGTGLFLYSDAMTEASDPAGQMLGEDGLAQMVEGASVDGRLSVDALLTNFFAWAKLPIEDDMTALHLFRLNGGLP